MLALLPWQLEHCTEFEYSIDASSLAKPSAQLCISFQSSDKVARPWLQVDSGSCRASNPGSLTHSIVPDVLPQPARAETGLLAVSVWCHCCFACFCWVHLWSMVHIHLSGDARPSSCSQTMCHSKSFVPIPLQLNPEDGAFYGPKMAVLSVNTRVYCRCPLDKSAIMPREGGPSKVPGP